MVQTSRRREFELWGRIAQSQLAAVADLEAWGLWVAQNGTRLGECEQHNPIAYAELKEAIRVNSERVTK